MNQPIPTLEVDPGGHPTDPIYGEIMDGLRDGFRYGSEIPPAWFSYAVQHGRVTLQRATEGEIFGHALSHTGPVVERLHSGDFVVLHAENHITSLRTLWLTGAAKARVVAAADVMREAQDATEAAAEAANRADASARSAREHADAAHAALRSAQEAKQRAFRIAERVGAG